MQLNKKEYKRRTGSRVQFPSSAHEAKGLEKEYHVSRYIIAYKFILGLFETFLGIGTIIFGRRIYEIYLNFKNSELLEDPHDILVALTQSILPYIFAHRGTDFKNRITK